MSSKEIAAALDMNPSSVRGRLSELHKAGVIERPERGMYRTEEKEEDMYYHHMSGIAYCSNKKKKFDIFTWKDDQEDISEQMFRVFEDETIESCGNHSASGYQSRLSDEIPEVEYPAIMVREK